MPLLSGKASVCSQSWTKADGETEVPLINTEAQSLCGHSVTVPQRSAHTGFVTMTVVTVPEASTVSRSQPVEASPDD